MIDLVRFSFALCPRIQALLQLRDGLRCLEEATAHTEPYLWLQAAADLRVSLLGEQIRKAAIPEIIGVLVSMQTHLEQLSAEHPRFVSGIQRSCTLLAQHIDTLRPGLPEAIEMLGKDSLIDSYYNAVKKQDWLAHKPGFAQSLRHLWHPTDARTTQLLQALQPLYTAVSDLDKMLHDYVTWEQRTASGGSDQIIPERGQNFGLLIVGLTPDILTQGIVPDISGNRLLINLRFQHLRIGTAAVDSTDDLAYSMMLVPIV